MRIAVGGEDLELLPERAVYWRRERLIALGDVHLGKAESLQREGIPIPAESGESDLRRLARLVENYEPARVCLLGDFIHHPRSWTPALTESLRAFFMTFQKIRWQLIIGNHERGSWEKLRELRLELTEGDVPVPPFVFAHGHEPRVGPEFRIEGHVHPILHLHDGPLRMKFPCFVLERDRLLLPSFGTWTGGVETERRRESRLFAVAPHEVFEVR